MNVFSKPISAMAVKQEMKNIQKCFVNDGCNSRLDVLCRYNNYNMHTIVCHNVGFHLNVFGAKTAIFENKCVFKVGSKQINHKGMEWGYSRGGGEHTGEFCYALLDWGSKQTRRLACI